jgi:hypothetical protein
MRRRTWKVQWQARPRPDGNERLERAVAMLLDRALGRPTTHVAVAAVHEANEQAAPTARKERP